MAQYTRILSIDGGGIRGIIPGQVLLTLEEKLKKVTGNTDTRIADHFDLVAGTSTGGILTCIYLCPDLGGNDPSRPRFSAQEAVDLYLDRGDDIFDVSLWKKMTSGAGAFDEIYDASELEETLDDYLDDIKLSQLLKPCLITAYNLKKRSTHFFTQHDAKLHNKNDFFVKDVARATSAAPVFFEAARIKSLSKVPYPLIDGGVFANNPTMCAYAEARKKLPGNPFAKDMAILSIGTGTLGKQAYNHKEVKDWGAVSWIKPLLDIMMSGVSETVDYQLQQIFDTLQPPNTSKQYLRINGSLENANPSMDDASQDNLIALKEDGTIIAEKHDKELDNFVQYLIN
jgi:patatin-like phospholipase/acyl hydrolase